MKSGTKIGLTLTAIAALAIPISVEAQTKIGELFNTRTVTISGEVTSIFDDEFILDDGTGQIIVEAESRPLRQANLASGEKVTVTGNYDDDEFEAVSITRANGENIPIYDD
ncbi:MULTISPECIES: NirD/YgiW/YdeI family stress tolerance protein [unclassified Coleofasciculus]|uniref:NirD/YgiW/YdeI family stress tolerance protein n=1 Tax=unclassified Coleofasciculus TaxID=2692782 RepID=UPI001881DCD1|nr:MULTISPECIES: NirD/YgiW/YdeI family stress tolerance protein [unclassified Coleofasciculus]MBE9127796.1 NirD/YgiW/YdeI family stress tolerance protein [Coleofasciculus sp. LEGE 07081]MBE9150037.1 NirD/YgiW/YdeI family stress tolerance protein [Coleofasciculus sp. LEGE 07092]